MSGHIGFLKQKRIDLIHFIAGHGRAPTWPPRRHEKTLHELLIDNYYRYQVVKDLHDLCLFMINLI